MDISILIVDDDKYLVDRLEETVQWKQIGISMVFTAYNIRQAQKLITEFPIQLLLCDIDMPQGSGLELLEWVRSQNIELECVFLSSYANFAYAQKALSLATREYLLKPISGQELEAVLEKVVQEYLQKANRLSGGKAAVGNDGVWEDFFQANSGQRAVLERAVAEGRYRWEDRLYLEMIRVHADVKEAGYRKELSLLHQKICKLAKDFFEQERLGPEAVLRVRESGWLLVVKEAGSFAEFCEVSKRWKSCLDTAIPYMACIYIGQPHPLAETERSYEILEMLEKRLLPGEDGILEERRGEYLLPEEAEADDPERSAAWEEVGNGPEQPAGCKEVGNGPGRPARRKEIGSSPEQPAGCKEVGNGPGRSAREEPGSSRDIPGEQCADAEECGALPWEIWQKSTDLAEELPAICEQICDWLRRVSDARLLTFERLEWFLKELEQFLYGYLGRKELDFSELFDSGAYIQMEKKAHISLGGILEFVHWIFGKLEGNSQNAKKRRDVVGQVKDYIEKNLGNEISRSLLAKEVWLSEDYVSKLFKSTTGMSLPAYIAARRIERAKEYLTHSGLPVSRIAMEVGYSNFSYFSKTFRDATGMTPNEYRSKQITARKTN